MADIEDEKNMFLTLEQINFYKKKLMNNLVEQIICQTNAKLFGGAPRDMIARKTRADDTLPQDLDFFVTNEADFTALIQYVETTYSVKCKNYGKGGYPWQLSRVRIPIFNQPVLQHDPNHLCVLLDLVFMEGPKQHEDFDVNSLVFSQSGTSTTTSSFTFKEIVQHIKDKKAYLLPQDKNVNLVKLDERCSSMMRRGWVLVTHFGEFSMLSEPKDCEWQDETHDEAMFSQTRKIAGDLFTDALCYECFYLALENGLKTKPIQEKTEKNLQAEFATFHL